MKDCQIVFELAALKHVPICEAMPFEAIETNIIGTKNVIQCTAEAQVEKVVYVSTDDLVLIDKTDAHGWKAKSFVKKAVGCRYNSSQDILNYADTEKFLQAANI